MLVPIGALAKLAILDLAPEEMERALVILSQQAPRQLLEALLLREIEAEKVDGQRERES